MTIIGRWERSTNSLLPPIESVFVAVNDIHSVENFNQFLGLSVLCHVYRTQNEWRFGDLAIWRQRLDRYAISNQAVTDFCKTERVSVPSFYQWKRRLSTPHRDPLPAKQTTRNRQPLQDDKAAVTSFTELVVSGQPTTAKALLPNGVTISLGGDVDLQA